MMKVQRTLLHLPVFFTLLSGLLLISCSEVERRPASGQSSLGATINENTFMSEKQRGDAIQICYALRSGRSILTMGHLGETLLIKQKEKTCTSEVFTQPHSVTGSLNFNKDGELFIEALDEDREPFFRNILTDRSEFIMKELCQRVFTESSVSRVFSIGGNMKAQVNLERNKAFDLVNIELASRSFTSRGSTAYTVFAYYDYKFAKGGDSYPSGLNHEVRYVGSCEEDLSEGALLDQFPVEEKIQTISPLSSNI